MPDATKKPTKKCGGWSAAHQYLATWSMPALIAPMKDLYDAAAVYRDFMQACCPADVSGGEIFEKCWNKVGEQFFRANGFGKLKLGDATRRTNQQKKKGNA